MEAVLTEDELHLRQVQAGEVLTRIENGDPVIYDHVAIIGDIDITGLDLPLVHYDRSSDQDGIAFVVASKIQIRNCELRGKINFANSLLRDSVDLSGSIFLEEARFKGTSFLAEARFEGSVFKRYATFKDAHFAKDAWFQGVCFSAITNFGNAIFDSHASFGTSSFSEVCTNFERTRFRKDADFTQSKFSGTANFRLAIFEKAASFWKAKFSADANFPGVKFAGYASFQSAILSGNADFRSSFFGEELNLEFTDFQGNAIFLGSCIAGNANFFRSKIIEVNFEDSSLEGDTQFIEATIGRASFIGSRFHGRASFIDSSFHDSASFSSAVFMGPANFGESRFHAKASFENAVFEKPANFLNSVFLAEASFDRSWFCDKASFSSSVFQTRSSFASAHFQEDAIFLGTQFIETSDFNKATFQKDLNLESARIHIMRLSDAVFKGQISLCNADFIRLEVRWPSICNHLAYDGAAYLSLSKNFKNLEWFEDADNCYYNYRKLSQSAKRLCVWKGMNIRINWSKLLDALAYISCGYGVRPMYTVFLSSLVIILFSLLFWAGDGIVVEPLNGSSPSLSLPENLTFLDNLYFSAMVFTAKTQVKWYPVGIYRYLATMESVLGWLLLALFLVTLGRTMIR